MPGVSRSLRSFFEWWLAELAELVPARLKELLRPGEQQLLVQWRSDELRLVTRGRQQSTLLAQLPAAARDAATTRAALVPILRGLKGRTWKTVLALPVEQSLRKVLSLPQGAADSLREVLALDMDRQTPFAADQVYFDARIIARDRLRKRIEVSLVVLSRSAVDAVVDRSRDLGLAPEEVHVMATDDAVVATIPLIGGSDHPRADGLRSRITRALAATAVTLIVAVIATSWVELRQQADRLEAELTALRTEAQLVDELRQEIERIERQKQFVFARKFNRPPFIEVMDELGRVLPDTAWLFRLRISDRQIEAFGYAPAASALISPIEEATLFTNVQFQAPSIRDPAIGSERFHLAFEIGDDTGRQK